MDENNKVVSSGTREISRHAIAFNVAARACVEEISQSRDTELMRKRDGVNQCELEETFEFCHNFRFRRREGSWWHFR
ncbi:hypothetical protein TcasGA2_TC013640 [Tribolium castaneum]|uniref:Uncharacterized protein n=1 Tax=Tribolium castaneum TaxID=7070 RepID=D6W6U3_TRICA|nr:hypothetical protein TcasGA2_TC013640 [Tribolium castaneum]